LAIIGGGAVELIATPFAVQLGTRVAFVEKDRIGGDCTWIGCVLIKTLIKKSEQLGIPVILVDEEAMVGFSQLKLD
jgi:pyruvate/2-oxoglutarate dehydrogenase complex dihydrolipoamide dehydrogenase (E3) component